MEVEEVRPAAASDLQGVAEALGRDQPRRHALAFGQGVDHDGGPVREERDVLGRDAALLEDFEHALLEVWRRAIGLAGDDLLRARLRVHREIDQVGERAADVRRRSDLRHWGLRDSSLGLGRRPTQRVLEQGDVLLMVVDRPPLLVLDLQPQLLEELVLAPGQPGGTGRAFDQSHGRVHQRFFEDHARGGDEEDEDRERVSAEALRATFHLRTPSRCRRHCDSTIGGLALDGLGGLRGDLPHADQQFGSAVIRQAEELLQNPLVPARREDQPEAEGSHREREVRAGGASVDASHQVLAALPGRLVALVAGPRRSGRPPARC